MNRRRYKVNYLVRGFIWQKYSRCHLRKRGQRSRSQGRHIFVRLSMPRINQNEMTESSNLVHRLSVVLAVVTRSAMCHFHRTMLRIARTMLSQDVRLSVHHTPVFRRNGYNISSDFFHSRVTAPF